jgi:hypothetical protein
MNRKLQIVLSYGGVPLASTSAPDLLHAVAEAALAESTARASTLSDPHMRAIENSETARLRTLFDGLGLKSTDPVM